MNQIGIVGAGIMGAGIAHIAALAGIPVVLSDVSSGILETAALRISNDLQKGVGKGKYSSEEVDRALSRIRTSVDVQLLSQCDVIIEAIVERLEAKHECFQKLEAICSAETILATNTSSLSITRIGSALRTPHRLIGMHFFNPPHLMKLVEIVRGVKTDDGTVAAATALATQLGKISVLVQDTPGFIVNRVARPLYGEALRLLGEGVASVEEIDRIVRLEGEFKMGPFELMDLIGIDINFAVTRSMFDQTFGEPRYRPHPIQQAMVNAGKLGRKTKQGFYRYDS